MSEILPVKSIEADGIQMGVLEDGTPFLTGRGLAIVCGVDEKSIRNWGAEAPQEGADFRLGKMAELLLAQGFEGADFYSKIKFEGSENGFKQDICPKNFLTT